LFVKLINFLSIKEIIPNIPPLSQRTIGFEAGLNDASTK
jgi:hypothetical protein